MGNKIAKAILLALVVGPWTVGVVAGFAMWLV
jgi:hypothetical protein